MNTQPDGEERLPAVILYRINAATRMHRFCRLDVQPDLFGAWCLMSEWGLIGSTGRTRNIPFSTPHEAQTALDKLRRAKERRGYHPLRGARLPVETGAPEKGTIEP